MCGISGIFHTDGKVPSRADIQTMNRVLAHRGPDDEGYHIDGPVALGHRRLSIIDLYSGRQPIYNDDRSLAIVFNGEIYNYQALKEELQQKGYQFRTETDTEVILYGYEAWGNDCVYRLRGMFAFAIWNGRNRELFLARDRLGIKPLYYFYDGQRFLFASELKAILEDKHVPRKLDIESLADYVSLGYVPAPKSIFRQIRKLPPGHWCVQSLQGTQIRKYWDLRFSPAQSYRESELCSSILEKLEESVKIRLISDVPLGAFLSGGIDSSMIVALMSRLTDAPVMTNTIGFTVQSYNEIEYARHSSGLLNTDHSELLVTPDIQETIRKLSWFYDEPFADASSVPTYFVSKMARERVTVALSGDGGDENFGGYRRYYFDLLENRIRGMLPDSVRNHVMPVLARMYPKADRLPQFLRAKTLLTNLAKDPVAAYFNSMSMVLPDLKKELFSRETMELLYGYDSESVFRSFYDDCDATHPLSKIQYIDFKTYLPEDILTKVDRASMANSLEVRVPMLDHEFVELAAGIPAGEKIKGKESKYIFKRASERLLPKEILNRKKMGFSLPVNEWLKTDLKPLVSETILTKEFADRGIFNQRCVEKLWDQHLKGTKNNFQALWILLSFELWARKYL